MSRSAAASPLRFISSFQHARHLRPFLLPIYRSVAYFSKTQRKPPAFARGGSQEPAGPGSALFQEITNLVASASNDAALQPGSNRIDVPGDVRCTEGVREIASGKVAADSGSITSSISDMVVLSGLPKDGDPRPSDNSVARAAVDMETLCRLEGYTAAGDSDFINNNEAVQRITEVIRSEAPRSSMEQRLDTLGAFYTPNVVNMVLKRCFKARQLGFWFFNWVKRVPGYHHTTGTYNTMLYIAGEAKSLGIMEELVVEMDREMCPKDVKTWTIQIASYGKARQIGKMLSTFDAMRKSGSVAIDGKVYRTILRALCHSDKPELALEFYKDMPKNMEVGSDILRLLMRCLATLDSGVEAVCLVRDDMIKGMKHAEEYCYMEALQSLCISGKLEEAFQIFQQMKNKSMANSCALETILRGLCRAGRMDEALQIMEYMKSRSGISSTAYGFLIHGYLKKGEHTKALDLVGVMREYGIAPLVSSYTQLMQHLFAINQYEEACGLYEDMLKDKVEPDVVAITALIGGHVCSGHISEAWDVFKNLDKNGQKPTLKAYTVFIQELCKASRPLDALELLKKMLESEFRPSEVTFCSVTSALRDKCYLEEASYAERMQASFNLRSPRDGLQSSPLYSVDNVDKFKRLCNSNPIDKELALEFISHCSDQNDKISSSSLPNDHQKEQAQDCSDGDVEEIFQILSSSDGWESTQQALEMRSVHFGPKLVEAILKRCKRNSRAALQFFSWVGRRPYYMPTTQTYNTAMKLAGSAKDFKHMWYLYREMIRTGCSPTVDTWNLLVCQYGNAGLSEKALQTFYDMRRNGFLPDKTTYNHLIMYLTHSKGRKVDDAIKIFQEMCRAGHTIGNDKLFMYLSALCESGKIDDARRSITSLCAQGFSVQSAYSIFLRSLCRADRIEEAFGLFDCIEKHGCFRDQYMYGSIIHALLRRDRLEDAVAKLAEMRNARIPQSAHIYTSFIVYYFQKRDNTKALNVLKEMKENGCEPTVVTYSALIRGHMAMGMVSEAWGVFHQMKLKGPAPDFETYSMFMSCLCKEGRSEDGLQLIHDMLDCGIIPSAVNFRTVVHGLNMEGKHELVESVLRSKWHLRRQRTISNYEADILNSVSDEDGMMSDAQSTPQKVTLYSQHVPMNHMNPEVSKILEESFGDHHCARVNVVDNRVLGGKELAPS
ncbi:hypothetical protein EJB05_15586, partial [Eragrostis curvula]